MQNPHVVGGIIILSRIIHYTHTVYSLIFINLHLFIFLTNNKMLTSQSIAILLVAQCFQFNEAFTPQFSSAVSRHSSALAMSGKNNHRARVEKNLEDMMDRDWRVFRARLVAQEAHEAKQETVQSKKKQKSNSSSHDEKQAKQEKIGGIFAAIFNHNKMNDSSIFNGDSIGGATSDSMIPDPCEDPFISRAEIPVLLQPNVQVDKHRWAHSLPHIEPGCVLVANEKLGGVFHQTVVLVIEHNDVNGSTGIVINR